MAEEDTRTQAQKKLEDFDGLNDKYAGKSRDTAYWQRRRTIELLESINKGIDVLVAAEYANAQATESLMQAFEGSGKGRSTEAFYNQRLLRQE